MDRCKFLEGIRLPLYQAGRAAQMLQGKVETQHKAKDSPAQESTEVSLADRLCQEILLLAAHQIEPGLSAYSEEWEACSPAVRELFDTQGDHVVVLDPIDGTVDYLDGHDTYGIMMGLLHRETGRMLLGALYFPATLELITGATDMGVWSSRGYWQPLRPLTPGRPNRVVAEIKRMRASDYARLETAGFGVEPAVSRSIAYEAARVTRGEIAGLVLRDFHGHDSACAVPLLEMLGGAALDATGKAVHYDADMPRLPLVILAHREEDAHAMYEVLQDESE